MKLIKKSETGHQEPKRIEFKDIDICGAGWIIPHEQSAMAVDPHKSDKASA